MRKVASAIVAAVMGLGVLYMAYLIGYDAGHAAGVIEAVTAQLEQAFRPPVNRGV